MKCPFRKEKRYIKSVYEQGIVRDYLTTKATASRVQECQMDCAGVLCRSYKSKRGKSVCQRIENENRSN